MEVLVVLGILGFLAFKGWQAFSRWAAQVARRQRDQQIETSIRLGIADAEAAERIAQRIAEERGQ